MKITLFGKGKIGSLIEELAHKQNHQIVELSQADVAIDFSHPSAVLTHLRLTLEKKIPLVIGTTGWENQELEAKKMVEEAKGSCLYAPNFSIGIFLFDKILKEVGKIMKDFPDYDVCGLEAHHNKKIDAPSGTAKLLRETLLKEMPQLSSLEFSSLRCGHIPGTHSLIFDSDVDTLTFTHTARSRKGFAKGALVAAKWILDKKGFFYFSDLFS